MSVLTHSWVDLPLNSRGFFLSGIQFPALPKLPHLPETLSISIFLDYRQRDHFTHGDGHMSVVLTRLQWLQSLILSFK